MDTNGGGWMGMDMNGVTTVTTHDLRHPKMHAKPIQAHTSRHEQVQSPQQNPSEQASTLATCPIFTKSIFHLVLTVFG